MSGTTASIRVSCQGGTSCRVSLRLSVVETRKGHRLVAVSARRRVKTVHKLVVLGTARATVGAGQSRTLRVKLNRTGRRLLTARHRIRVSLRVTQNSAGANTTRSKQKVTFKAPKPKRHHRR